MLQGYVAAFALQAASSAGASMHGMHHLMTALPCIAWLNAIHLAKYCVLSTIR